MKVDLLGAKCLPSSAPMSHAVVPFVGLPAASVHSNAAPPHVWTSIPRCCLYQARSATGSFALKKIPPIPVTLFISASEVQPSWSVLRLRRPTLAFSRGGRARTPFCFEPDDHRRLQRVVSRVFTRPPRPTGAALKR